MDGPGTYAFVLVCGIVLTAGIGRLLIRHGQAFLEDIFGDVRTAESMSRLLGVLFYLITLGVLALLSIVELPTEDAVTTVIAKLGVMLLVLGVAHGATMLALIQIRRRRREQAVADELHEQVEQFRARHHDTRDPQEAQEQHGEASQPEPPRPPPPVAGGPSIAAPEPPHQPPPVAGGPSVQG